MFVNYVEFYFVLSRETSRGIKWLVKNAPECKITTPLHSSIVHIGEEIVNMKDQNLRVEKNHKFSNVKVSRRHRNKFLSVPVAF